METPSYTSQQSKEKQVLTVQINPDKTITGKGKFSYTGNQYDFNLFYVSLSQKEKNDAVKSKFSHLNFENVEMNNFTNNKDLASIDFDLNFKASNYSKAMGDSFIFRAVPIYSSGFYHTDENRQLPFENRFSYEDDYEIEYQIPTNYVVEEMPQNGLITSDFGTYLISFVKKEDKIIVKRSVNIKKGIHSKEKYNEYVNFRKKIISADNSKNSNIQKIIIMNKILFVVCASAISSATFAQKHEFLKMPKFTIEDLKKAKSNIDEKAPAEILYRSIHYRVDPYKGQLIKNYAYRIKIYDKDKSEDLLNLDISLYDNNSGSREILSSFKAYVYNLENDKISETRVDKSSKFKSKENKYIIVNKYAFPNIINGSVIDYQYEVASPFLYEIPLIYMELDTPSIYSEYVLDAPTNMSYHIDFTGSLKPKHQKVGDEFLYGADFKTYRFAYENVKAFKGEKFVKNNDNYRTKIRAELHSTFFNSGLKTFTSTWEDIRKKLWEHEEFGLQYKKDKLVKDLLPKNISEEKDELKKANSIFDFVKNTYTWNHTAGFYTENGLKRTGENQNRKYG